MRVESLLRFERHNDEGDREIDVFELAFRPFARVSDYPDLLEGLERDYEVTGFEQAKRFRNALAPDGDLTDTFPLAYLRKARAVLVALRAALERDLAIDYSPTPEQLVAVLLDVRKQQIANVEPAIDLLDRAVLTLANRDMAAAVERAIEDGLA